MKETAKDKFIKACEEYSDALFRYSSFKISDREMAKDLVQETFMKTWTSITKGEKIQNIRAYFYRVLGNLIIDEYRKKKLVSLDLLSENGFDLTAPEENVEDKIDGERAIALLRHIPENYRELIFMRYVEDMSLDEISQITGKSKNWVAVNIYRGLKKIKKIYNTNINNEQQI